MNLEFKKKELNLSLYGETIAMRFPTIREFREYEEKAKKSDDEFELMKSFLCSLGMTIEQIEVCYPDDLGSIVSALSGEKGK